VAARIAVRITARVAVREGGCYASRLEIESHVPGARPGDGPPLITALSALRNDQCAVLRSVRGERGFRRRLLELGFLPGTPLRMVRRVDVGDILEVDLRHSRVSLRLSEARGIEVDLSAPAARERA
jgi:ferrous iron transport protein A